MARYVCARCGKEFSVIGKAKYCSDKCREESYRQQHREKNREYQHKQAGTPLVPRVEGKYEKVCIYCGKTFLADDYRSRICSGECRKLNERERKSRKPIPKRKAQPDHVAEAAVEARRLGMSYGKLIAWRQQHG